MNTASLSFVHLNWDGEQMQGSIKTKGPSSVPQELILTQYIGRNMGVPVEMLAYEYPPKWTFDKALAFSLIYGIIPRPNDTGKPLEIISKIWGIIDKFPVSDSEWIPFYKNRVLYAENKNVCVSCYSHNGEKLIFVTNVSESDIKCNICADTAVSKVTDCLKDNVCQINDNSFGIEIGSFETQIFRIK